MPRFHYQKVSTPDSKTFLKFKNCPILNVGLLSGTSQVVVIVEAYIDTGAQLCLFDNSYAKFLGIKDYRNTKGSEDIVPLFGVGGREQANTAYCHDLKLVIFKDQKNLKLKDALKIVETKIGFLEKPIPVAGILGVYGFLDHFSFNPPSRNSPPVRVGMDSERNSASARFSLCRAEAKRKIPRV